MSVVLLLYRETGHVPRFNPSHDFEQVLPLGRVSSWNARLQSIAIHVELPLSVCGRSDLCCVILAWYLFSLPLRSKQTQSILHGKPHVDLDQLETSRIILVHGIKSMHLFTTMPSCSKQSLLYGL